MAGSKTATKLSLKLKPVAARYIAGLRFSTGEASPSLEIDFENGSSYRYPVDRLDFSRWNGTTYVPLAPKPTDADLEAVVLWPNGEIVEFENIDQGFEVAQLISEIYQLAQTIGLPFLAAARLSEIKADQALREWVRWRSLPRESQSLLKKSLGFAIAQSVDRLLATLIAISTDP